MAAWIFNRVIITCLKKLALKTHFEFDDHLFSLLHSPIYNSILLLGLASASLILSPPQLTLNIIFSVIQTIGGVPAVHGIMALNRQTAAVLTATLVLVRPGEEHDVEPVESLESGDDVRRDVLVGVADVRGTVRVRDGCGAIEGGP